MRAVEVLFRHFWVAFIIVTLVNGRAWWNRAQSRIRLNPELEPGYRRLYRGYLFWMNVPWVVMGLGILSGQVPSIFHFLRPSHGNSFVLAWWGMMVALLSLGTYWVFGGGGAEMLERHPGVYMMPQWSADKLRRLWLGIIAWNVAIAAFLLLGFRGKLTQPGELPDEPSSLWTLFPVFFVGMWLVASFLLSAVGGWQTLALHYRAQSQFSGRRFHFRSAQFGGYVNYGGCLTFGAGPAGLYLAVLPLFRMAHPPLIIPWSDITARDARSGFFSAVELEFAKVPGASVRLSRRLAQSLFDASGIQALVHPPP
jgi:hypothetical protein